MKKYLIILFGVLSLNTAQATHCIQVSDTVTTCSDGSSSYSNGTGTTVYSNGGKSYSDGSGNSYYNDGRTSHTDSLGNTHYSDGKACINLGNGMTSCD